MVMEAMLLQLCLCLLLLHACVGAMIRDEGQFSHFDVWDRSPHENCSNFAGCLTMDDRENYLNPEATSIPCGFLAPSDLDRVREYFMKDKTCKVVLFSLIMGAYNFAYNPISSTHFLKEDESICLFLFVDEATLMNGHGILQLAPNHQNTRPQHKSTIVGGENTWKIILVNDLASSKNQGIAHVSKMIKLNGLRLFPNAEWVIYIDSKYIVNSNPWKLINYVKHHTNHSLAAYAHFYDSVPDGFKGAIGRLNYQNSQNKNKNLKAEIQSIENQKRLYEGEGLFKVYNETWKGQQIDAAMLIARNDNRARRFFCSWQNEVSMFSRRDQLSFHSVQHRLQIFTYKIWKREMLGGGNQFMKNLARIKPKYPPQWDMYNASHPHPFTLHPCTSRGA